MNIYYCSSPFKIGNPIYSTYLCQGQRGRGKTTYWIHSALEWYFKNPKTNKFVYLRRSDKQMELALEKGLFTTNRTVPEYATLLEGLSNESYRNNNITFKDAFGKPVHVGYTCTLNNVKSVQIEDANVCIFDEYVELKRSDYKGGDAGIHEPELLFRLLETIFRGRNFWLIILGNRDSVTNPYNEYFHIPFNATSWRSKKRGIMYEVDVSEALTEVKRKTTLGRLTEGTPYDAYSNELVGLDSVSDDLIAEKPAHAVQSYNIKIFGSKLTVWWDEVNGINYVTDACKFNNQYPIMSVTTNDMSIDTNFVAYNSEFLMIQKTLFAVGRLRFNSQKTASLYYTMMKLI